MNEHNPTELEAHEEKRSRVRRAPSAVRRGVWLGLVFFWAAYGFSVAWLNFRASIIACTIAAVAYFGASHFLPRTNQKNYAFSNSAFGLLAAIPLGLILSIAIPVEYFLDYAAFLKLGRTLYATGDYTDWYETLAFRPPGMALLYGFPIHIGVPEQISVWIVNSAIAAIVLWWTRSYLQRSPATGSLPAVLGAGLLACLATLPYLLLPISHLPSIAIMVFLLVLVPTEFDAFTRMSPRAWLTVGLLIGVSALFRANLILEILIFSAALVLAHRRDRTDYPARNAGMAILLCALGMAIAIGPWTIRNWLTLDRFVPISTNGGMVFYSANGAVNSWEQGRYNAELYQELTRDVSNEVDRNSEGWRRGWANIAAHPLSFISSFRYRVPRLLEDPLFPVNYVRQRARGGESWMAGLDAVRGTVLVAFWCLWLRMIPHRNAIRGRVFDVNALPWPQVSLLMIAFISLLFEISPTYQLSLLPFILFIWLDARANPGRA